MSGQTKIENLEVLPASTMRDLVGAEISSQVDIAKRHPRDLASFQRRATARATVDKDTAASCLYRRNVGRDKNGEIQWAEGNSIRMAEIAAKVYGNLRYGAELVEIGDKHVITRGFCHDLESNSAVYAHVVSPCITKDGNPFGDRMKILVAQAGISKALRDAVFSIITPSECREIEKACRKMIAGVGETLEQRKEKLKVWLSKLSIAPERVYAAVGVKGLGDITADHLANLAGMWTAVQDGDVTLEEQFPPIEQSHKPAMKKAAKKKAAPKAQESPSAPPKSKEAPTDDGGKEAPPEATVEDLRAFQSFLVSHGIGLSQVKTRLAAGDMVEFATEAGVQSWKDLEDVSFEGARSIMMKPVLLKDLIDRYAVNKDGDAGPVEGVNVPDELMI